MTWIFTYGASMIEPELRKRGAQPAVLAGYHRSFNHASTLLWGTRDRPCPTLGLSSGGECWGLAFEIPFTSRRHFFKQLAPTEAADEFLRRRLPVTLDGAGQKRAVVWISKPQYEVPNPLAEDAIERTFTEAHGTAGRGIEYVRAVVQALDLWKLDDPMIRNIWQKLETWRPR